MAVNGAGSATRVRLGYGERGDILAGLDLGRDADSDVSAGDILGDDRVGADLYIVADVDAAEDLGPGADIDAIANDGRAAFVAAQ